MAGLRDMALVRRLLVPAMACLRPAERRPDWIAFPMYHHFRPEDRAAFRAQLAVMRGLGDFIGLDDAAAMLAGAGPRGRYFCLTFDDGWQGPVRHAPPLLAEAGATAAFFVVPDWIDAGMGLQDGRRLPVLGWPECRALAQAGMTIGSHSLDHARLAGLADAAAQVQIAASGARIAAELGQPCRHFAAPWGQPGVDYRPARDPQAAQAAGYASFLTTIRAPALPGASPYAIPRLRLEPGWGRAELRYAFGL